MKHLQYTYETPETLETRLQHACISNILIYFCDIQMKQLQHTSETDETFGTYT
jgi:hypothetical protein